MRRTILGLIAGAVLLGLSGCKKTEPEQPVGPSQPRRMMKAPGAKP